MSSRSGGTQRGGLAHDDIRALIARADEIQRSSTLDDADLEEVIQAAAEVGIGRNAIERAIRERMPAPMQVPGVGALVFARSADDKYYVAEVADATDDSIRVHFLHGSTHSASLDDLRPCSLLPGSRVVVQWPWWGPWTCTVIKYDAAARRVDLSDGWGDTRNFGLDEIWLAPPTANAARRKRVYTALIAAGAAVGAAIGSLVTALIG